MIMIIIMNHIAITFTATRAFEKHHYMFIGDDTLTSKFCISYLHARFVQTIRFSLN